MRSDKGIHAEERKAVSPSLGAIVSSGPMPHMHYVICRSSGSNSVSFRPGRRESYTRPEEGKHDLAVFLK